MLGLETLQIHLRLHIEPSWVRSMTLTQLQFFLEYISNWAAPIQESRSTNEYEKSVSVKARCPTDHSKLLSTASAVVEINPQKLNLHFPFLSLPFPPLVECSRFNYYLRVWYQERKHSAKRTLDRERVDQVSPSPFFPFRFLLSIPPYSRSAKSPSRENVHAWAYSENWFIWIVVQRIIGCSITMLWVERLSARSNDDF